VADQSIGYIVSLVVIAGIGWALPRWFGWRHAMRRRLLDAKEEGRHV
jgi:hypothetical protein